MEGRDGKWCARVRVCVRVWVCVCGFVIVAVWSGVVLLIY